MTKPWFLSDGISAFRRRTVQGIGANTSHSLDFHIGGIWRNEQLKYDGPKTQEALKYFMEIGLKEEPEVIEVVPPLSEKEERARKENEERSIARHSRLTASPNQGSGSCYAPGGAWRYENE